MMRRSYQSSSSLLIAKLKKHFEMNSIVIFLAIASITIAAATSLDHGYKVEVKHEYKQHEPSHHHESHGGESYANHNSHHDGGHDDHHDDHHEPHHYPKYNYEYGVKDEKTKDHKSQWEHRDGDVVHGEYTLDEADGTHRIVKYSSDKKTGFQAHVENIGHAHHHH